MFQIASLRKIPKPLMILALLVLVLGIFCSGYHNIAGAYMLNDVSMLSAQSVDNCCSATFLQHNKYLNDKYQFAFIETNRNIMNLLVLGILLLSMIFKRNSSNDIASRLSILHKLYTRDNLNFSIFHYFVLAFSQGILNSKKYNLAFN